MCICRVQLTKLQPFAGRNVLESNNNLNRARRSLFSGRLFDDPLFGGFGPIFSDNDNSLSLDNLFDDLMNDMEIDLPGLKLPFKIAPSISSGKSPYISPFKPNKSANRNKIINQRPNINNTTNERKHIADAGHNGNSIRLRNFNDVSSGRGEV